MLCTAPPAHKKTPPRAPAAQCGTHGATRRNPRAWAYACSLSPRIKLALAWVIYWGENDDRPKEVVGLQQPLPHPHSMEDRDSEHSNEEDEYQSEGTVRVAGTCIPPHPLPAKHPIPLNASSYFPTPSSPISNSSPLFHSPRWTAVTLTLKVTMGTGREAITQCMWVRCTMVATV